MFGSGGIGAQIDKKVGALTGNPQAMQQLQQKQKTQQGKGVTPDLLDALALQKVMSDKALAKQQLALSQQQDAGTVVEQMEQKLVGMNKEELTAQTAGIMGERNKQRQQQVSSGKPPQATSQRPPMQMAQGAPQGAPQGLPAAPRPPMQMAQGGIIGYATGGITDIDVENWLKDNPNVFPQGSDAVRRKAAMEALTKEATSERRNAPVSTQERAEFKKNNPTVFPKAEDSVIDKIIQEERFGTRTLSPEPIAKDISVGSKSISDAQSSALQGAMGIGGGSPQAGSISGIAAEAKRKQDAIAQQGQQPVGVLKPGGIPSVPDMKGAGVLEPPAGQPPAGQPPALDVDQQLQEIINTPATDYTTISKKQATDAMGSKFNTQLDKRMAVDPEAKKQAVTETLSGPSQTPVLDAEGKPVIGPEGKPVMKATGGYDRQGKAEGLAKYLKQKEDLDKAALDPDAIAKGRNQAYMDGLITGGTGRTGTAARSRFDANIARSKQDSISEQKAMYMEDMKFDNEIADKIGTQALKVFEVYTTDVAKAMDTASTIGIANLDMFYKEAKMAYDSNQDGIKNKIDAIKTSTAAKLNELIQSQATMQEISSAAINLTKEVGKLKENFYSTLAAEKLGIESELTKKETTSERRKQLLAQLDEYEIRFAAQKEILEADAFMQILKTMMEESGRNNGFSSQTKQQVQQIVKTSTGTSQQQTTGGSSRGISSVLGGQQTGAAATLNKYAPAG